MIELVIAEGFRLEYCDTLDYYFCLKDGQASKSLDRHLFSGAENSLSRRKRKNETTQYPPQPAPTANSPAAGHAAILRIRAVPRRTCSCKVGQ